MSVVVATFRRPRGLSALLGGLSQQRQPPPFEVVVVDNDPSGSARSAVVEHGTAVRYVRESRPGASHARNTGVAASRAEVLAITDDDVVPDPGWLAALTTPLLHGEADVTGGPVCLDPHVARPRWWDESISGYLSGFSLGPCARALTGADDYLLTANLGVRRGQVLQAGGFDPWLGPRGRIHLVGDDARLVRELRRRGADVRYVPDAVVVHELPPQRLRRSYLLRRAYAQGRSDWRLDREQLAQRRFGGVRVAASWLGAELGRRSREGWGSPAVRFHATCDVVRTAGAFREALSPRLASRPD